MYNYNNLYPIVNKGKEVLSNDFHYIFIERKVSSNKNENKENDVINILDQLKIEPKTEPIYKKITSKESLKSTSDLVREYYDEFIDNFLDLYDRVEENMAFEDIDDEAFAIIEKTLKNRKKKIDSALRKIEMQESISKTQEEFFYLIQKHLEDIIKNLLNAILIGLKRNNLYEAILIDFNKFLSNFGIYTYDLEINKKLSEEEWGLINPLDCDDCETNDISKKDMIKSIEFYPYLMGDKLVLGADTNLWKVVTNG